MDIDNSTIQTQRIIALNGGAQIRASETGPAGVARVGNKTFGNAGANSLGIAFTPSLASSVYINTQYGLDSIVFNNSTGPVLTTPSIPPGSAWEWTPTLMAQPFGSLPILDIVVTNNCAADTIQAIVGTA